MADYISREHWGHIGGYLFNTKYEVIITSNNLYADIAIPELNIGGRGLNWREAYWQLLFQFERGLRETKEFTSEDWVKLRRLNGVEK